MNTTTRLFDRTKRSWRTTTLQMVCLSFIALFLGPPSEARNANFRMGFRTAINVPGPNFMQPPLVDGDINGDLGWTGAFRYVFGNGTLTPDVVVQAIRDGTSIYLSFEVNNDQAFEDQDLIVLTIDPTGVAADAHRIHIYPVFGGVGAGAGGAPRQVQHWKDSASWNTGGATSAMPGGLIKVSSAGAAPNVSWFVELSLPLAAYSIPAAGDFGLYFNVIRVSAKGVPIGTAVEKDWPTVCPDISLDVDGGTPDMSTWGTASTSGIANGVSIAASAIVTGNTPNSKIAFPPGANVFSATVLNNSVDSAGVAIAANRVTALFRIANFGIPAFGDWTPVPTGNNPTPVPGITVPAGGTATLSTSPWTLTAGQAAQYAAPHDHQCILVELDSTDVNTVFVNKSAWRNMDFGPASVFERSAEISAKGYGKPPAGQKNHQFDLHVTTKADVIRRQTNVTHVAVEGPISQLTWAAHGYRRTGRYLIIQKQKFEIVDHAGSFGYIVQHAGLIAAWNQKLKGSGLRTTGNNLYRLQVPEDGIATVTTAVRTLDKSPGGAGCFTAKSAGTVVATAGLGLLGLVVHLPWRRRNGSAQRTPTLL
jgi:hypothetical protein